MVLSSSVEEKPIFELRLTLKWLILSIVIGQVVVSFITFLFISALIGLVAGIVAAICLVLGTQILIYFAILSPTRSWKIEIFENRLKVYYHGDLLQDTSYSDIVQIRLKRYGLFSKRYVLYGSGDKVIVAIPSNPRRRELDGSRVVDWLKKMITPSTEI